ncbi:MAG: efflux RND transporter permease subunit [Thermoanaerobaculia bacterium]|nr:efflux RND transporter permease subunit [Thermoanaerobaculia bacterium]
MTRSDGAGAPDEPAVPDSQPLTAPPREGPAAEAETALPRSEFAGETAAPRGSFAARRPVAVGVVFLAAVLFGWLSYFQLPVNLMPELTYPTLTVRTEYPGAAPEEVENEISRPIEEELGVIGGLERISSISRAGVSDVVLEFQWQTSIADAVQDTLERLDQVFLPEQAERPLVLRFDPSLDPVIELSLSGEGERFAGEEGLRRLRRIADRQVKRELEPIKGVAAVQVRGGLEEEIHVRLDRAALARTGISPRLVLQRLAEENVNVAGGTLEEGRVEYMVRTLNEYTSIEQIGATVVTALEGRPVRISDLGEVALAHRERQIRTRSGGHESVALDLFKEGDANMVALSRRIRAALGDLPAAGEETASAAAGQPGGKRAGKRDGKPLAVARRLLADEGVRLEIVADRSVFIESSISEVRNSALAGGLLAVLVLYLFLRSLRSTAIVAVAIPASLLVTFAPLDLLGVSLNIMSLGGLALGVGMLVDCSIVVLESIQRCREEGDELFDAVVRGTREVRSAVIASTLTTVAVFLPMVFVEGVAGQAFGDLALAVVLSLLASLAVALFLIPMLAARRGVALDLASPRPVLRPAAWSSLVADWRATSGWRRALLAPLLALRTLVWLPAEVAGKLLGALATGAVLLVGGAAGLALRALARLLDRGPAAWTSRGLERLASGYRALLARTLEAPRLVLGGLVAALALTVLGFLALDSELLPEVHQGEITFELALPAGTPLERTIELLEPVERALLADATRVERVLATYGFDPAQSTRSDEGEHTARFRVLLRRADAATEQEVAERVRSRLLAIPDLEERLTRPVLFSFRTPIEVEVHGDDLDRLAQQAAAVERRLAALPELADVASTLRAGAPEVEIVYDRERLALSGLSLAPVAESVRDLVRGAEATLFNLKDRRIPIVVQLAESDRRTVEDVRELVVNPGGERPVPLAAIADVRLGEGPSEVRRIDGRRVALVRANLAPGVPLGLAVERLRTALDRDVVWPPELTYFVSGQDEEWQRSAGSLYLALALSIFLVYVIMAAQFESLVHPFVILFTIPLAFFGSIAALALFDLSLSIVVFLGMILLAGIVVNNAIVLVDYVNVLRQRGLARREALLTAGVVRLRPILMTTATTVLGLLPMALGLGDGAELRTPMAVTVIAGLTVSTLLTLVVIPVVYDRLDALLARAPGRAPAPAAPALAAPALADGGEELA